MCKHIKDDGVLSEKKVIGKDVRAVIKAGGSLAVTLPSEFVKAHNVKSRDKVDVYYNDFIRIERIDTKELDKKMHDGHEARTKNSGGRQR